MYHIEFSRTAEKQLYKLNKDTQKRVVAVLERISVRPFDFIKRLFNNPYYRLRVGDYRLILDVRQNEKSIFVVEVGHRSKIYGNI